MGGALGAKSFPFPSTVGGSQGVSPLNKSQAPTLNTGITSPAATLQNPAQPTLPSQVPQPVRSPLSPLGPVIQGQMPSYNALYGM